MDFLRRFMAGRYGNDQLNAALLVLGLVLIVIEMVTGWGWMGMFILALLILCFPIDGILASGVAALVGSALPVPRSLVDAPRADGGGAADDGAGKAVETAVDPDAAGADAVASTAMDEER